MLSINIFLLIAGFFLPPVAVILMTAPTLVPIVEAVGFDPIWFAVVLTINMEIGLITPPVGLNLYVINGIAPDVTTADNPLGRLAVYALYGPGDHTSLSLPGYRTVASRGLDGTSTLGGGHG